MSAKVAAYLCRRGLRGCLNQSKGCTMGIFLYVSKHDHEDIVSIFKNGGYDELETALTREEAVIKLSLDDRDQPAYRPDLIVWDVSVDRSSLELCKKIKDMHNYCDVPIIVLSNSSTPEEFQTAFTYGVTDYVEKPMRTYELLTRVRSALKMKFEIDRRKSRERELVESTRQLSDLNTVLNRLSLIDALTSVPNRRCFDQSIEQEYKLSIRNKTPISLIMLDIDYFKNYNDAYGHQAGDLCLQKVAQCLTGCLRRPSDLVARYGGEEFAVILPDTDAKGVAFIAAKIKTAIEGLCIPHGLSEVEDRITLSQGCATYDSLEGTSVESLIESADKALYDAKKQGRNRITTYQAPRTVADKSA